MTIEKQVIESKPIDRDELIYIGAMVHDVKNMAGALPGKLLFLKDVKGARKINVWAESCQKLLRVDEQKWFEKMLTESESDKKGKMVDEGLGAEYGSFRDSLFENSVDISDRLSDKLPNKEAYIKEMAELGGDFVSKYLWALGKRMEVFKEIWTEGLITIKNEEIFELLRDSITISSKEIEEKILEAKTVPNWKEYEVVMEEIELGEILDRKRVELMERSEYKLGVINIETEGQMKIVSDETIINKCLENVLLNAIKYGVDKDGNRLRIDVKAYKEGDETIIKVTDRGVGMREEDVKAFNQEIRPGRLSSGDKEVGGQRIKGSGFGLYGSRLYLAKIGGKMEVESKEGEGSSFYIRIPDHYSVV